MEKGSASLFHMRKWYLSDAEIIVRFHCLQRRAEMIFQGKRSKWRGSTQKPREDQATWVSKRKLDLMNASDVYFSLDQKEGNWRTWSRVGSIRDESCSPSSLRRRLRRTVLKFSTYNRKIRLVLCLQMAVERRCCALRSPERMRTQDGRQQ